MSAPAHVKTRADEARKLMSRPPPQPEATPEQKTEKPKERIDPTDYKARFSQLLHSRDARYEQSQAEVERLTREVDELSRRIAENQPPVQDNSFHLSEEERERLGEDGATVVESVVKHVDSRFEKSEEEKRVAEEKAYARFVQQVNIRVPNWQELNKDPGFAAWLGVVDDELQTTPQSLLERGVDLRDVELIGSVFDRYFNNADNQPNAQHEPSPEPDVRSTEATGDVYEEWFEADEIAAHYTEKTRMQRLRKTSGAAWDAVMERQIRIDDAVRNNRILKNGTINR